MLRLIKFKYKNQISLNSIKINSILLFIGLSVLFPSYLLFLKILLLLLPITISISKNEYYISKKLFYWTCLSIIINVYTTFVGILNNSPGFQYYIKIYFIWPIIYLIFASIINSIELKRILNIIKKCIFIIIITGLFAFVKFNLNFGLSEQSFLFFKSAIRPGFPFIAIASQVIVPFIFWYFFFCTYFLINNTKLNFYNILFILLGILFILVTSRRALFLGFLLMIIIIPLYLNNISNKKIKKRFNTTLFSCLIIVSILVIFLNSIGFIDISDIVGNYTNKGESLDSERLDQFNSLYYGWLENPIFGHGTGINASVVRSNIPGTYELTYLAKLFESGIFIFCIYIALYAVIFIWLINVLRKNYVDKPIVVSTIVAFLIFLISNGTNPYLGAFDFMWFLYIPFIIININDNLKIKYGSPH